MDTISNKWRNTRGGAELYHPDGSVAARVVACRYIGVHHPDGRPIRDERSGLSAGTLRSLAIMDLRDAGYGVSP